MIYICIQKVLGNISLGGCNIKAGMCVVTAYAYRWLPCIHITFFYEIPITCCIIWLSTLASKAKHSQYHRDENASKTKRIIPWFLCHRNLKGINCVSWTIKQPVPEYLESQAQFEINMQKILLLKNFSGLPTTLSEWEKKYLIKLQQ